MIGGQPQPPAQNEQTQSIRTDIKNVLPFDLYEGMMRASFLITETYESSTSIDPEKIKNFVHVFWTVYNLTKLKVDNELKDQIEKWFENMKIPLPTRQGFPKNEYLLLGIRLYKRFYDELVKLGIGSMFEEPIMPPIALTSELEDEDIWKDAPQ